MGMTDDIFQKRVEWILHLGILFVNIPITSTSLFLDTYHQSPIGFCYCAKAVGCEDNSHTTSNISSNKSHEECTKGEHTDLFLFFGGMAIHTIIILGILACLLVINLQMSNDSQAKHRNRKKQTHKFELDGVGGNEIKNLSRNDRKEPVSQAVLYGASCCVIFVIPSIALVHSYTLA